MFSKASCHLELFPIIRMIIKKKKAGFFLLLLECFYINLLTVSFFG